ncbi:MAG: CpaF family protein [Nanoarchaeota archaeon]|nr:CpaF family protein [Nanoarchaeota archaeon]
MAEDYLKDLITKVKEAKKEEDAEKKKKKPLKAEKHIPKEVPAESIPREELAKQKNVESKLEEQLKVLEKKRVSKVVGPVAKPAPAAQKAESPAIKPGELKAMEKARKLVEGDKTVEKSTAEKDMEEAGKRIEVASYGTVKIYKIPGKPLLYYMIPVPRPTASEKAIINTVKEVATRLISIAPYRIRDPEQRRVVYRQQVLDILKSSHELRIPERRFEFYADAVVREMVGYGIIDPLVRDDKLEEIMVIGPKHPVYIFHREYEMMTTNIEFYSDNEIQDLVNRIARQIGRRVDISSPLLDARLPDGSRVNATIPPASVAGSSLTIRKFREDPYTIIDLINMGTMSSELAAFLWLAVEGANTRPANILISGGTGSGKTTTLNVMAAFIPEGERIVSIEDTAELSLPLKHWIRLESRPPGLEGKGELTLDILTKNSLRMRPDRVIVGEVRHDEAFSLFTAMNTGHDGSLGTVHANSPQETIVRVTSPPMNVPEIMLSGLDMIIVQHRLHDRKKGTIRRITEVAELTGVLEGRAQSQTIFERDPVDDTIRRTNIPSVYIKKLQDFTGMTRKQLDSEMNDRERFLETLVKKGIRSMEDVSRATQDFLLEKKER